MKLIKLFLFLIVMLTLLSSCGASPKEKAYKSQENVNNERLALVEKYQKCVKDAGDDKIKVEACDQYLKAAEALK